MKLILREIASSLRGGFDQTYLDLVELFNSKSRFVRMENRFFDEKNWPEGSGVYVIWRKVDGGSPQLIYIGKTGTYRRVRLSVAINKEKDKFKKNSLKRWTPYCFLEGRNFFCYGPKFKEKPDTPGEENYKQCIPITEIQIDFFVCGTGSVAPAFLEAFLLQIHIDEITALPPANNQF